MKLESRELKTNIKMKKILILVSSTLAYTIIASILIPFLSFNFGAKSSVIEMILKFIIEFPFGYVKFFSEKYFLIIMLLNGFTWTCLIYLIVVGLRKLLH